MNNINKKTNVQRKIDIIFIIIIYYHSKNIYYNDNLKVNNLCIIYMNALQHIVHLLMNSIMNIVLKAIYNNYISIGSNEEKDLINNINNLFFE